jgi:protein YibB
MNNITIVTAFFDINRGNMPTVVNGMATPLWQERTTETYFSWFENLAQMNNDMVVITTVEYAAWVIDIRMKLGKTNTTVITVPSCIPEEYPGLRERMATIMNDPAFYNQLRRGYYSMEYWSPEYDIVNFAKPAWVCKAIDAGVVKTELVAWIDFGYARDTRSLPPSRNWTYEFNPDKIYLYGERALDANRPISDIVLTGDVYVHGPQAIAGREKWPKYKKLMEESLFSLLDQNLVDDDQTIMMMSCLRSPDDFNYQVVGWWFDAMITYNTTMY